MTSPNQRRESATTPASMSTQSRCSAPCARAAAKVCPVPSAIPSTRFGDATKSPGRCPKARCGPIEVATHAALMNKRRPPRLSSVTMTWLLTPSSKSRTVIIAGRRAS